MRPYISITSMCIDKIPDRVGYLTWRVFRVFSRKTTEGGLQEILDSQNFSGILIYA